MSASGSFDPTVTDEFIPTITLSSDDLGGGSGGAQNISGVLSSSRDAFVSAAAFTFGPARFNIRGYDAKYTSVLVNGMPVNDLETGRVFWNHWGGLNDVLRNRTNTIGLGASIFAYGGVGGASTIDTRAISQRKQLRFGYAISNRTYRNRLMATYSSGLLESGWAFSLSASRRWADEGYVEGTFYDAYSYFASVDRRLGDIGFLNFTVFGAPIKRGKISGATQEVYDLAGTNYYNANWGLQNGKVRNSRVQDIHQPVFMLRNDLDLSDKLKLSTTVGYQTGRTGNTALDWYDGPDPRPIYYRKLPSFFEGEVADQIADLWATDINTRQVNWDQIYQINYNSFQTIENANGIEGNTVSGLRSQYIVEDRRNDMSRLNANSVLEMYANEHLTIQVGAQYQNQTTENYKLVQDLLGGEFYLNVDRFAEFDSTGIFVENNVDVPNQILREGDRWGYDYRYEMRKGGAWAQANFRYPKVDFFVAGSYGQSKTWRVGLIPNGKFPETSAGDSETVSFDEIGVKGTPNEVFTLGLNYNSPKYWFANINFNYFNGTWLDFFPERRTPEAVSYTDDPEVIQQVVTPDSDLWNSILDQERTPSAFTVDLFGGKSWKINDFFIYLNVGVNNLLDKQDFRTGGYEQFRFDFEVLGLTFNACVDQDFDEPPVRVLPSLEANATIKQVKDLHTLGSNATEITEDWIIAGTVVADDESGNLYQQLVIEDESAGVIIRLGNTGLYTLYPVGTEVFVRLQGLYVNDFNNLYQIAGDETGGLIPSPLIGEYVVAGETKEVTPTPTSLEEIFASQATFDNLLSRLISLEDMQFADVDLGDTYAVPGGGGGQNRTMVDCFGNSITVRNSDFADFAAEYA
eukprot:g114.t1